MAGRILLLIALLLGLTCTAHAAPHAIPFEVHNGLIYIRADVAGQKLRLIIDTGAALTTVGCPLVGTRFVSKMTVMTATGSSIAEVNDTAISLNGYVIRRNVLSGAFKFTDADGVLGNDVLSTFKLVSFDYKNKTIVLEN